VVRRFGLLSGHHAGIGAALLAATVALVLFRYARSSKRPLPVRGRVGFAIIIAALILEPSPAPWRLAACLTPIACTGYLLLAGGEDFRAAGARLRRISGLRPGVTRHAGIPAHAPESRPGLRRKIGRNRPPSQPPQMGRMKPLCLALNPQR
jgi:hypothetical protein